MTSLRIIVAIMLALISGAAIFANCPGTLQGL